MLGKIVAGVIGGFIVSFFAGNVITLVGGSKGGAAAVGLIVWGGGYRCCFEITERLRR